MSSAAKLRNRGIAIAGATAIVMTSFGPAAFAYRAPDADTTTPGTQAPTTSYQAGAASFGLTDTDKNTPGTQGAVAVTPGVSGQAVGQMKFVLPSTWQAGDSIDFIVSGGTNGTTYPADATKRVSYSSTPAVQISGTAYNERTHIADTSPSATSAVPGGAAPASGTLDQGSTEDGKLTAYTPAGSETPAQAPKFSTSLISRGTSNYQNVLRITFSNDSDAAAARAKFIGTIDAKFDVGTAVTGAIPVVADGVDLAASGDADDLTFFGDTDSPRNVTYPAAVQPASLDVQNGSVVADGTNQNVGPLTVATANGGSLTQGQAVTVGLNGATFTGDPVTVNFYNAVGTLVGTAQTAQAAGVNQLTAAVPTVAGQTITKAVFTNPMVTAPTAGTKLTYSLVAAGGAANAPLTSPLGGTGTPTHQTDIVAPSVVTATQPVATDLPDRIGGQDRYQTAVKIAERAEGTNPTDGPVGESDNVVIASGEGFADALSAGYLAATKDAQLLLTRAGSLPQTDIEFLKTYGAKNVYIVGGTGSVSKAVEDQLKELTSYDVQAADNATRPATVPGKATFNVTTSGETNSFTVTDATGLTDRAAIKATGNTISATRNASGDLTSVSVNGTTAGVSVPTGGLAGASGTVTWTVGGQAFTITVPSATAAAGTQTSAFDAAVTTVPGQPTTGTEPIPADEATGSNRKVVPLTSKLTVTRIAGSDRFETNRKVNEYAGATSTNPVGSMVPEYGKSGAKTALVTNGMLPWDALSAGPLVGVTGGSTLYPIPLILTDGKSSLNQNAKMQMQSLDIENAVFIGGSGVLPDSNMGDADKLGAYTHRVSGSDRWTTAAAVSEFALRDSAASTTNKFPGLGFPASRPYLANGGSINGNTGSAVAKGAWADALAAGPSAAADQRIIALTDSTSLPKATADMLKTNAADLSKPVIAAETVQAANAALGG